MSLDSNMKSAVIQWANARLRAIINRELCRGLSLAEDSLPTSAIVIHGYSSCEFSGDTEDVNHLNHSTQIHDTDETRANRSVRCNAA